MRPFLAKGALAVSTILVASIGAGYAVSFSSPAPAFAQQSRFFAPGDRAHSFYFTRAAYSQGGRGRGGFGGGGGGGSWATDYPKADLQFLVVLRRLTNLDAFPRENPVRLDDPDLRSYPFIYTVEVGNMDLTEQEVKSLREYLLAGGFMVADDFWGHSEWAQFERQMRRVFPEYPITEIPQDHEVRRAFYDVEEIIQVPNVGNGEAGGPTCEDCYNGGTVPHLRGIFDEKGRLMVAINWNTDLGDAWEWAERPMYPLKFSTYAYQMGVNFIVYSMSH